MMLRGAIRLARPSTCSALLLSRPVPLALTRGITARTLSSSNTSSEASSSDASAKPEAEPEVAAAADEAVKSEVGGDAMTEDEAAPAVEELKSRIELLEAEVASKHEQVLRSLAEAENARRRAGIDVENAHKFAVGKFAKSLLDVADNLNRAAECVPEEMRESEEHPVLKALYDGVVMTEKTLIKTFAEHGMKRSWPIDEKFDPNVHNALFEMPDPTKEPGTIAHVASAGFVLHDRVIRAAGVGIVSKPS